MANIDTVINAIETCISIQASCDQCPYHKDCDHDGTKLFMDILELLKSERAHYRSEQGEGE